MDLTEILKLIPSFGLGGAIFGFIWNLERLAHAKTTEELYRQINLRVADSMEMAKVIAANTEASNARDRSQDRISASTDALANLVTQAMITGQRNQAILLGPRQ
jgi:hypothetical protein